MFVSAALTGVCVCVSAVELSPTHAEQQKREQILAGLERFIRKEYNGEEDSTQPSWSVCG